MLNTFSFPETRDGVEVALVEPDLLLVHRLLPVERRRDRLGSGPGDSARLPLAEAEAEAAAAGVGGGVDWKLLLAVGGKIIFAIEIVHLGVQVPGQLEQTSEEPCSGKEELQISFIQHHPLTRAALRTVGAYIFLRNNFPWKKVLFYP